MSPPMSWRDVLVGGVGGDRLDQRLGGEDVVAHRGVDLVGRVRQAERVGRLLPERRDLAPVGRGLDHAELVGLVASARGSPATVTPAPEAMCWSTICARVHAVDVVGAEDDDVVRPLVGDQVVVLVDRVGAAHEPARAAAHLRGHRRDVVAEQRRQPPGERDVAVEAVALVLREHDDPAVVRVGEVGQREVDQPVVAAERYGGLGAVGGQRRQALALAAGQHHREDVHPRASRASAMIRSRCSSPWSDSA